jgi:serine/threonine-protein kinase
MFGRYRIVRALGSGGMGAVYEAAHADGGKLVALKLLAADLATDARSRARFLREAEAASKIDHPNVVKVIDYGADESVPFIVMQLLRGEDLGHRLSRTLGGLQVTEAVDMQLGVCAGVFAAHQAGVVHRDLKPTNIFLARLPGDEVAPKVLDFGISKVQDPLVSASLTDPGAILGTTPYLSPEHVAGEEADARSDQYALGVVLYESLTGHRPYDDDTREILLRSIRAGRFPAPSKLRADLPPPLEAVILRALASERSDRFPDVRALGAALFPFASAKARAAWAHFCGEQALDQPPSPGKAAGGGNQEVAKPLLLAAPAPRVPLQTTVHPRAVPEDCPPTMLHEARAVGETLTRESRQLRQRRGTPWLFIVAAGVTVVGGGRLLLDRSSTEAVPQETTQEIAAAVASGAAESVAPGSSTSGVLPSATVPLAPSPARAEPDATAIQPQAVAIPQEVLLRVVDAPPGLVAELDAKVVELPIRVQRGDAPVTITFRAPGFQARRMSVTRNADQRLAVGMRPEAAGPRPGVGRRLPGAQRQPDARIKKPEYILKL